MKRLTSLICLTHVTNAELVKKQGAGSMSGLLSAVRLVNGSDDGPGNARN